MPKLANSTVEVCPLPHCHTAKFPCWKRKGPMEPTSHQRKLMDYSNKINKSYQIIYPEFHAFHAFHGCGPDIGLSNHEVIRDHHTFEVCWGWIHPLQDALCRMPFAGSRAWRTHDFFFHDQPSSNVERYPSAAANMHGDSELKQVATNAPGTREVNLVVSIKVTWPIYLLVAIALSLSLSLSLLWLSCTYSELMWVGSTL